VDRDISIFPFCYAYESFVFKSEVEESRTKAESKNLHYKFNNLSVILNFVIAEIRLHDIPGS